MKVLAACEFSGVVRRAFHAAGHEAWSCDLLPAEDGEKQFHIQGDVSNHLTGWDLIVAFPPCTLLTRAGARWWKGKEREQLAALRFVHLIMCAPAPKIAVENPPGRIGTQIRKADQTIQPWQFGHGETKATSLWLQGLPLLRPTKVVEGRVPRVFFEAPGPDRWRRRSRTYPGIAQAMAEQWGGAQ